MAGIGIGELVVLIVIALMIARSRCPGRTAAWFGLGILALATLGIGYAKVRGREQRQAAFEQIVAQQNAMLSARMPSSLTLAPPPVLAANVVQSTAWFKMLLFVLIPVGVFSLARRSRSAGAAIAFALAIILLLSFFGVFFVHSVRVGPAQVYVTPAPAVISGGQATAVVPLTQNAAEEPIDELWDRLNKPQIPLTAEAPAESESSEHSADDSHADVVVENADAPQTPASSGLVTGGVTVSSATSGHDAKKPQIGESSVATVEREETPSHNVRPKPDWVVNPPKLVTGEVRRYVVEAGPYQTVNECYARLRDEMRRVVQQRVQDLAMAATGQAYVYAPPLEWMHLSDDYIVRELLTDEFVDVNDTSVGDMRTAWGLLEFTDAQDQRLLDGWKSYARREGIAVTGAISAGVLTVLGGIFALLKIDTWTRGYYTKRLFLGVPAAIIGLILLVVAASH